MVRSFSLRTTRHEPSINVAQYKHKHASQHRRDEDLIEQIYEINERKNSRARLIVTKPGVCKRSGRCVWMALLAFDQQVFLESNPCVGVIHLENIMMPMAIGADGFVGRLIGEILFEHFHGRTVEIGHIGIQHICGKTILLHQRFVGMAIGAKKGDAVAERIGCWTLNIVDTMTIRAGGNIRVVFVD